MTERNRPRQVTVAAWVIVLGSLAALVTVYDQLARLHTLDMRESVQRTLAEPPFDGIGLGVHTVLDVMHALALVTAACATAAVVLGWHVLKRHRASRVALTVVAVPMLVAGVGTGGFFSTLVAVAVLLLWLPPAGEWFGEQKPAEPPVERAPAAPPPTRPAAPYAAAPPTRVQRPAGVRPGVVTWAAVLTWVYSAATAVLMIVTAAIVAADPGPVLRQMLEQDPALADQGMTEGLVVASMWFVTVVVVAYCVTASVMAVLAWRRVAWARTTLVVLVAIAVATLLLGTLLAPVLIVGLTGAVVTLALLLRHDSRAWFEGR